MERLKDGSHGVAASEGRDARNRSAFSFLVRCAGFVSRVLPHQKPVTRILCSLLLLVLKSIKKPSLAYLQTSQVKDFTAAQQ